MLCKTTSFLTVLMLSATQQWWYNGMDVYTILIVYWGDPIVMAKAMMT